MCLADVWSTLFFANVIVSIGHVAYCKTGTAYIHLEASCKLLYTSFWDHGTGQQHECQAATVHPIHPDLHCREVANGNNLEQGLEKPLMIAVDLRKNGPAQDCVPGQFFGNAVGGSFCMPPNVTTAPQKSHASSEVATPAQDRSKQQKALPGECYTSIVLAAALAVRQGLEALRADPHCLQVQAAGIAQYAGMPPEQMHKLLASPDFLPARDVALWVSSWVNMPTDRVDFGGGKAEVLLGSVMPACLRAVNVTSGPEGDGLMCILRLPRDGLAKVQQSQLLNHIAPEAQLLVQSHHGE